MAKVKLSKSEIASIDACVELCKSRQEQFESFASGLVGNLRTHTGLGDHIHFIKYRIKDPEHLRSKLERKAYERKSAPKRKSRRASAPITVDNLFQGVNDLIGVRIIHLHTDQMSQIHRSLMGFFQEQQFRLVEKPTASCWDFQYEDFYRGLGIRTRKTKGYSSVHYVIEVNRKTKWTCEIQVRTLTDEVWGEVSHLVNYPETSPSEVCREQLETLARFTTGCTRLVDTIFRVDGEARR